MRFFYVRLRTYAQYASINEFTCSEHSVRIRRSKKSSTGNQPLGLRAAAITFAHDIIRFVYDMNSPFILSVITLTR